MSVFSFQFIFMVWLLGSVTFLTPGPVWRRALIGAANVVFLAVCLPNSASWTVLASFVLSGYLVAVILRRFPSRLVLGIYIAGLVTAFALLKQYAFVKSMTPDWLLRHPISTVGLSYLLFRQIHFLVDVAQDQIHVFTLASYANYQLNLFGFLSGPIQRYQDFQETWDCWQPVLKTRHQIVIAFMRVLLGVLKIAVSTFVLTVFEIQKNWFLADAHGGYSHLYVTRKFLILVYSYPIYLYLNFAGYCDVVIAAAALVGIRLPENFDRPYLSRNILDFWTRWHRSLGFWIRDYLFTPMYKFVAERWSDRAWLLVFPCYFLAFCIAGLWHGAAINFLIFGALHGIGICISKAWEAAIVRRHGRKGLKQYLASNSIRYAAIVLTLNFFALTLLFFPFDVDETARVVASFMHRVMA